MPDLPPSFNFEPPSPPTLSYWDELIDELGDYAICPPPGPDDEATQPNEDQR